MSKRCAHVCLSACNHQQIQMLLRFIDLLLRCLFLHRPWFCAAQNFDKIKRHLLSNNLIGFILKFFPSHFKFLVLFLFLNGFYVLYSKNFAPRCQRLHQYLNFERIKWDFLSCFFLLTPILVVGAFFCSFILFVNVIQVDAYKFKALILLN